MASLIDRLERIALAAGRRYLAARRGQREQAMSQAVRDARNWAAQAYAPVYGLDSELLENSSVKPAWLLLQAPADVKLRRFALLLHKGKIKEVPAELWEYLAGRSTTPYSNDVFIAFEAADLSSAPNSQKSFYIDHLAAGGEIALRNPESASDGHLRVYVGNGTILTQTAFGRKIFVDADDIELTPHLVAEGMWERWVGDFIRKELREGDHFMDIGANCGYFTLLGADIVGHSGAVVAVEPVNRLRSLLSKSLQVNGFGGFAYLEGSALSNESGAGKIYVHPERRGSSSLWNATWESEEIEKKTFPEILEAASRSLGRPFEPRFIKMDIEGNEYYAWQSMREWAAGRKPLTMILEFSPSNYQSLGQAPLDFYDELREAGFSIDRLFHDGRLAPFSAEDVGAVPSGGHVDLVLRK